MHRLIALLLITSTALLVEIKCQTTNGTTLLETRHVPEVDTLGTAATEIPEVHCGAPGPFPNGWIDATQDLPLGMSKVGRTIVYRCNVNMKLIGVSTAVCEIRGRWSSNPPQCLASCPVPVVDHGVIRDAPTGSIILHGGNVTLECNRSYQPAHGLSMYICNNGTLNVPPRCDPAPKGNCARPEILNGTFVQIDGKNVTRNQTYEAGTEIIYRCKNPDHRVIDTELENSKRVCDATTNNWTGTPPKCAETCGSVIAESIKANNDLHLRFNITYDETVLSGGRYKIGTKAIMSCNFGERVIHPSTAAENNNPVVCQSNGTWRGFVPLCDPPPNYLDLSKIAIIVACLVSVLIFSVAVVLLCQSRSRRQQRNRAAENNYRRTDGQRMGAELLRQSRQKTFYALEDRPDGEREYATIHRAGQGSRRPRLTVEYSKL